MRVDHAARRAATRNEEVSRRRQTSEPIFFDEPSGFGKENPLVCLFSFSRARERDERDARGGDRTVRGGSNAEWFRAPWGLERRKVSSTLKEWKVCGARVCVGPARGV